MAQDKVSRSLHTSKKKVSRKTTQSKKVATKEEVKKSTMVEPKVVATAPTENRSAPVSSLGLTWLALVLSFFALCAGGYAWYATAIQSTLDMGLQKNNITLLGEQIEQVRADLSAKNNEELRLNEQINALQNTLNNELAKMQSQISQQQLSMRDALNSNATKLDSEILQIRNEFSILVDSVARIRKAFSRGIDSWKIEEVEQLIEFARQWLVLSNNTNLAAKALKLAVEKLLTLANPGYSDIINALNADIDLLNQSHQRGVGVIVGDLAQLSQSIERLSLKGDHQFDQYAQANQNEFIENDESNIEKETGDQDLSQIVKPLVNAGSKFFTALGDMIQVEKHGQSVKTIISVEMRHFMYTRVQLILDAAQLALLRKNPELYENRINEARSWVLNNFEDGELTVNKWVDELDALSQPEPLTLPDLTKTLMTLSHVKRANDSGN